MNRPIPAGDYVEHFDPELAHHRACLLAVLELRVLWKAAVQTKAPEAQAPQAWPEKPATVTGIPPAVAVALSLVQEFEGCRLTA